MPAQSLSLNAATDIDITQATTQSGNKPERLRWFGDLALGMFIHWSLDVQLGVVISHSLVGASPDYVERYFTELPRTFCPNRFDPDEWARLAKVAGFRYVVFTTKHHSGFCMFETATTDFGVMHTPFGQDITRQVIEAFRRQGLAIGLYFSPDDFSVLRRQGIEIARSRPEVDPINNPELMAINRAQIRELLSNYGPIDLIFFDGQPEGLKQLAWELQPDIVVTRGDIATPEQHVPDTPLPMPWESCVTMGTAWQYQPTNETYKSGRELIEMLAETRAKGGNLLLNVGPKPNGELPDVQTGLLMELGLWNFVNGEAIFGSRPWQVTREEGVGIPVRRKMTRSTPSSPTRRGANRKPPPGIRGRRASASMAGAPASPCAACAPPPIRKSSFWARPAGTWSIATTSTRAHAGARTMTACTSRS